MNLFLIFLECPSPVALGMEGSDLFIADDMITGSGYVDDLQKPMHGRLKHRSNWGIAIGFELSWLQVDFIMITIVLGVSTQGNGNNNGMSIL